MCPDVDGGGPASNEEREAFGGGGDDGDFFGEMDWGKKAAKEAAKATISQENPRLIWHPYRSEEFI